MKTIPHRKLQAWSDALVEYRGDGRTDVLFNASDRGNYVGTYWDQGLAELLKADPTGLAAGMMIREQLEATLCSSKVSLTRVLREEGFLAGLQTILDVQGEVDAAIAAPKAALMRKVDHALAALSPELGATSPLEMAICLRDAIHSMERGLTLRWLECDPDVSVGDAPIALCNAVTAYPDIGTFVGALRSVMPAGAHLARIGLGQTAIGIKQHGRIAYLSSLSLSASGDVVQRRDDDYGVEELDLDTPVDRYPAWTTGTGFVEPQYSVRVPGGGGLRYPTIASLPRDRLVWLAMVVEIATQRMSEADPGAVELAERLVLALPQRGLNGAQGAETLPALIKPNWRSADLTVADVLGDLELSSWELKFLAPALRDRTAAHFQPVSAGELLLHLDSGTLLEAPGPQDEGDWVTDHVAVMALDPNWVGTRVETEAVARTLFVRNLASYLMAWGNRQWRLEWDAVKPGLRERFAAALPRALMATCGTVSVPAFTTLYGLHLHRQSPKHKTYKPLCFFSASGRRGIKTEVTHVLHMQPVTAAEVVEVLGFESESDLPGFLQGWSRDCSWAADTRHGYVGPAGTFARWAFAGVHSKSHVVEFSVAINVHNVPEAVAAHILAQPVSQRGGRR